ncbi:MAG: response regulator [Syntrophobacteria bacterium]|jgi:CheY-like chemotaxis protein|nr:response regulator [Deltaproteobacteria bacterium]
MASKSILIIEDNPMNLKLIRDVLQIEGYETLEAETGETGVELARERHPAVILMDVNLPQMDGREAMKILKADASTRQIPIIAVTSLAMKGDRERLLAAGFDGYISKPIDIKELPRLVESYVAR